MIVVRFSTVLSGWLSALFVVTVLVELTSMRPVGVTPTSTGFSVFASLVLIRELSVLKALSF